MKRLITATTLAMAFSLAQADPIYHPAGSNLTYGAVSNGQSIVSDITNPAAGAAILQKEGNQYRFGIISSIGAGAEFGDVDNFFDDLDTLATLYDTTSLNITGPITGAAISAEVDSIINTANTIMQDIAIDGYAKGFGSVHLPLMPLVVAHKALGGSIVLDVNASLAFKAFALEESIAFNAATPITLGTTQTIGDVTIDSTTPASSTFSIANDSSVITKAAETREIALGYSRPFFKTNDATLYGGLRGRYYKVGLSRLVVRMFDLTDTEELFEDAKDADFTTDSGFGVDIGTLWVSKHYRLGATMTNINEPEFEFDSVDLSGFTNPTGSVAQQIANDTTYTMEKQLSVEASVYTENQNWVISAGYDANAIEDALGDEYQWATVSAAYATDSSWLPGIRAGIRKNLAGSEIDYYTFGTTISVVNIDVAWSPDEVTIDDETVPRGVMFNLGLEVTF